MQRFMSVEEAGRELGVGRARAYQLVRAGQLPVVVLGRRLRVPRRVLDELEQAAVDRARAALKPLPK